MNKHILPRVVCRLASVALITIWGCSREPTAISPAAKPEQIQVPLIQRVEALDWCKEHVVPESICTRCDVALIPEFKAKGDWCAQHDLPESQCFACHPDLEAKFRAMEPRAGG